MAEMHILLESWQFLLHICNPWQDKRSINAIMPVVYQIILNEQVKYETESGLIIWLFLKQAGAELCQAQCLFGFD